jgi:hypothetical protein
LKHIVQLFLAFKNTERIQLEISFYTGQNAGNK